MLILTEIKSNARVKLSFPCCSAGLQWAAMNYIVRHGVMRFLGEYEPVPSEAAYARGQQVVVRSERGLEAAEVLCESTPSAVQYLTEPTKGQIVRVMVEDDHAQAQANKAKEQTAYTRCREFIEERKLQMELVDVEYLFGGERVVFYFL